MKTKLSVLPFLFFFCLCAKSQMITPSVINAGGMVSTDANISVDWSIGEVALVNTMGLTSKKAILTNGFFQPDKFSKNSYANVFGVDEITILPNPTTGLFTIKLETVQLGSVVIRIYDASGKEVYAKNTRNHVSPFVERVDLTAHPAGTYMIHIHMTPFPGFNPKYGSYRIVKI